MEYFGTFGPNCHTGEQLKALLEAGMTGIRLNLSHKNLEECREWILAYQEAQAELGMAARLLIDLKGPELRLGNLEETLFLQKGQALLLDPCGNESKSSESENSEVMISEAEALGSVLPVIPVPEILEAYLQKGQALLLNDGTVRLEVVEKVYDEPADKALTDKTDMEVTLFEKVTEKTDEKNRKNRKSKKSKKSRSRIMCRVLRGGEVGSRKSIALEQVEVPSPTLTPEDLENLKVAESFCVTDVMLPFVRGKEDIQNLRQALKECGAENIQIHAKIENKRGVEKLEEILEETDAVVIARGDLGQAYPLWELPVVQKKIAAACCRKQIPFMVVTQMLQSMIKNPVPTRAEVMDIYNAVADGAASLMLTGETAVGEYPEEAMAYLVKTAEAAGKYLYGNP